MEYCEMFTNDVSPPNHYAVGQVTEEAAPVTLLYDDAQPLGEVRARLCGFYQPGTKAYLCEY